MKKGKYDIFISYRRKESSGRSNVSKARTFQQAFKEHGYKVFFDYSECTDDYFYKKILPAIRTCDFFVLILTKDCFLRCSNEKDWVRREIQEAIDNKRKIIPITLDDECLSLPQGLPESLRKTLDGLQITNVHNDHMFDGCIDYLIKERFKLNNEKRSERSKMSLLLGVMAISIISIIIFIMGILINSRRVQEDNNRRYRRYQDLDTVSVENDNNISISEDDLVPVGNEELDRLDVGANFGQTIDPSRDISIRESTNNEVETQSAPDGLLHGYSSDSTSIIFFSRSNDMRFVMKLVEGGTYLMGAQNEDYSKPNYDEKADVNESPVRQVKVKSFYLGETEVTQELWRYITGAEPSNKRVWNYGRGENYPAYYVSWKDCQSFIEKLNNLTGCKFRLPTEEEWEFAARGRKKGNGYKYAGGDAMDVLGWYGRNSGETYITGPLTVDVWKRVRDTNKNKTHPVKTKSPNELGFYDMSGNVWELCSNKSISKDGKYLQRGGSWGAQEDFCRVSSRQYLPDERNATGFRLALTE